MAQWIQVAIAIAAMCGSTATAYVALIVRSLQHEMRSMREILEQQLTIQGEEIAALRKWRHDFGQKEMVYDNLVERVTSNEERLRLIETAIAMHIGQGVK